MSQDTKNIKSLELLRQLAFVKDLSLITVKVLSAKVAEQLPWWNDEGVTRVEVIGALNGIAIVRNEQGQLGRMNMLPFILHLEDKGATNAEANEALRHLPQLFTS